MSITIRGTKARPSNPNDCGSENNTTDFVKIIDDALAADPLNRVDPNSQLFEFALQQFSNDFKISKVRPEIPEFFCGYIDPDTGDILEVRSRSTDPNIPGSVVSEPIDVETLAAQLPDFFKFKNDDCLYGGRPGSYGYMLCDQGADDPSLVGSGIDWNGAIFSAASRGTAGAGHDIGDENGADDGTGGTGGGVDPVSSECQALRNEAESKKRQLLDYVERHGNNKLTARWRQEIYALYRNNSACLGPKPSGRELGLTGSSLSNFLSVATAVSSIVTAFVTNSVVSGVTSLITSRDELRSGRRSNRSSSSQSARGSGGKGGRFRR
jgi:hypothetical protein